MACVCSGYNVDVYWLITEHYSPVLSIKQKAI